MCQRKLRHQEQTDRKSHQVPPAKISYKDPTIPNVVPLEGLPHDGHPNRFTIFEVWKSRQAVNSNAPVMIFFSEVNPAC
jgi:hypothetical protein